MICSAWRIRTCNQCVGRYCVVEVDHEADVDDCCLCGSVNTIVSPSATNCCCVVRIKNFTTSFSGREHVRRQEHELELIRLSMPRSRGGRP